MRGTLDALIAGSSRIPNDPVLASDTFAWTETLRANWQAIQAEALAVLQRPEGIPLIDEISPDHSDIAPPGKWRSYFLHGYGCSVPTNLARCPATAALVGAIPGMNSAFFSILSPGAKIPPHRGVTKALVTCHLGLIVPEGSMGMRVADQQVRWREGETIIFDDSWEHQVWNDTDATRVILLIQARRPLRAPGRWLADGFLGLIRRSPFVREAQRNMELWEASVRNVERTHALNRAA